MVLNRPMNKKCCWMLSIDLHRMMSDQLLMMQMKKKSYQEI